MLSRLELRKKVKLSRWFGFSNELDSPKWKHLVTIRFNWVSEIT